jgi:hypothetical protein
MICKECKKQGLKSNIFPGGASTTLMSRSPFYDENGVYHSHDPNVTTQSFRCSNEHNWTEKFHSACPAKNCEWNKNLNVQSF